MSDPERAASARMTPERWAQLEPLIDAALDLAPNQRAAFYESVTTSHPELRADLERLVGRAEDERGLFSSAAAEQFALLFDEETDMVSELQASLGTAYSLERELGGGGMSRVFLARESELGRRVVIKVLPPELAAGINAERFDREIKLAASLQQANIVPLLATGRAAGYAYYTMPFVEGRSLRDRLAREGVLPIGDAVNLLRDVARALAYAHAQGVVHRDVKPGNVLLSAGTAVVTDFGIAKALTAARGGGRLEAITHGGPGIGTPPYMAPEQAAGDPAIDHRADIYAFGCLAYEVFTGKPPFHGHAPHVIIAAHFQDAPRPVSEGRSDVPPAIAALIAQCLEKNPARRPQSAAELLDSLDAAPGQPTKPVRRASNATLLRSAVALTAAAIVGAAGYLAYRNARVVDTTAPPAPLSLAAIPFRNLTRDSALEYRADGIGDEILTAMGKIPGVRIIGRNAGRRYKDRNIDERAVQRELGAVFLMTGTYDERGGRIVVSTAVSDSITGGELWADSFEIASTDLSRLPDSIARVVVSQLHARYADSVGEPTRGAIRAATNNGAYQEYLDGQFLVKRRQIKEGVKRFEAAIRLDSAFARAHGALATALTFYPWFYGTPHAGVRDTVLKTARRALAIDTTVADAHSAMAMAYAGGAEWDTATKHFQRALALDPDNFDTHFNFGRISTMRGELREARTQFELARTIEPTFPLLAAWSSYVHFLSGEADSARAQSVRAFRVDSMMSAVTNLGALVYLGTGSRDEARRLAARQPPLPMTTAPYVYAKLRDTAMALRLVTTIESINPRPWVVEAQRASVMLGIGDTARALSALEQSGPMWVAVIPPCDPAWDPVRQSPRFAALIRRARLDEQLLTALGGCSQLSGRASR